MLEGVFILVSAERYLAQSPTCEQGVGFGQGLSGQQGTGALQPPAQQHGLI